MTVQQQILEQVTLLAVLMMIGQCTLTIVVGMTKAPQQHKTLQIAGVILGIITCVLYIVLFIKKIVPIQDVLLAAIFPIVWGYWRHTA